jgi:septal ring factor EnvC (AmiA/AmiB activator)
MNLSDDDKQWFAGAVDNAVETKTRGIVREVVHEVVSELLSEIIMPQFDRTEVELKQETSSIRRDIAGLQSTVDGLQHDVKDKLEMLENDVKAIYQLVADLQKTEHKNDKDIKKLEKYIRDTDAKLHNLAIATGITL